MVFYDKVQALSDLLAGRRDTVELDSAALLVATIEYPGLEINRYRREIDRHAELVSRRLGPCSSGRDFVMAANAYLFEELGFHGNTTDYYNPANSCLNDVLTLRTGIPITLSVLYIEIARRLARPVRGIGLPGHFVVRYDDGAFQTYIDPFHGGRLLDAGDCLEVARSVSRGAAPFDRSVLAPVTNRQIITRMLNNLRGIYFARRAHRKALAVLNLLIGANPGSAEEYKQRALVHQQTGRMREARADFERYLELAPEAADRAEVETQLGSIRRWQVRLN